MPTPATGTDRPKSSPTPQVRTLCDSHLKNSKGEKERERTRERESARAEKGRGLDGSLLRLTLANLTYPPPPAVPSSSSPPPPLLLLLLVHCTALHCAAGGLFAIMRGVEGDEDTLSATVQLGAQSSLWFDQTIAREEAICVDVCGRVWTTSMPPPSHTHTPLTAHLFYRTHFLASMSCCRIARLFTFVRIDQSG
jgi:hypothetical protein